MFCDEHGTADYCGECVYGPQIAELQQQLAAAQVEARHITVRAENADDCGGPSRTKKPQ